VHDFDLANFRPHAPGYPVYVALLRVANLVARDPMRACVVVAACSGVLAIGLVWLTVRRLAGAWAAWTVAGTVAVLPIVWRAFSGVGSEGPAFACGAACAWGLAIPRGERSPAWKHAVALGLGVGLGLGVRLSWAPLFLAALALAPSGQRSRTWATAAAACLAWAVPLVAVVGASQLAQIAGTHLLGHVERWGGTAATQPGAVRLVWLLRDVFVDGFGAGPGPLGWAIGLLVAAAIVAALVAWGMSGWPDWRAALAVSAPYLAWVAIGQNVRDQPRHVLPLVAMLGAAVALRAARSPRALGIVCALVLLVSMRTARDVLARRSIPPAGEQLVELAREQPPSARPAVFGVASVRFFELSELAKNAFAAASLGDVAVQVARLDRLPPRVWVTSEVERLGDAQWPLVRVATVCRPPRLDRRAPCLDIDEWILPGLPRQP